MMLVRAFKIINQYINGKRTHANDENNIMAKYQRIIMEKMRRIGYLEHRKVYVPISQIICATATIKNKPRNEHLHKNAYCIGIDMLSTYCLTNDIGDFTADTVQSVGHKVTGIGGKNSSTITYKRSGTFKLIDDLGTTCIVPVPELLYCETSPYRIISPQHLDQRWKEDKIGSFSTATDGDGTLIMWVYSNKLKHTKFIPHTEKSNIPIFSGAPQYKRYREYLRTTPEARIDEKEMVMCLAGTEKQYSPRLYQVDTER
jgi:hypothetical protein